MNIEGGPVKKLLIFFRACSTIMETVDIKMVLIKGSDGYLQGIELLFRLDKKQNQKIYIHLKLYTNNNNIIDRKSNKCMEMKGQVYLCECGFFCSVPIEFNLNSSPTKKFTVLGKCCTVF